MHSRKKIMVTAIVVIVILVAALGTMMVFSKTTDLLDSEFRVIVTGSMDGEPQPYDIETIPVNSLIAIHKMHDHMLYDVKVGDVIGFHSDALNGNIYHRVISVDPDKREFTTKGDAASSTETVPFDEANGLVVNVNHAAGQVVVFVKANLFLLAVIVVLVLIMSEGISYILKNWRD